MKTSKLAYKNFKGNFYRYVMYALSNAFAVTAFFVFANFVFHPAFDPKNLGGHAVAAMGAIAGMGASQIIIVMFSILFVGYSTNIFLKSRGKEFGLLSLYGMTKKQIRRYVARENRLLSLFSVSIGILVGGVFSKLFLMIMENLLGIDLYFNISIKAVGLTFLVFFLLFQVTSYIMLFRLRDKEIVEQIRSTRKPMALPDFSKIKAILGFVILLIAYGVAWFVDGLLVPLAMIPVTIVTIIGTYFLFTQFCIFLASKFRNSKKVKYDKVKLISSSQLIFKLKDTAKVMFLASILIAVSLTATETIVSFYTEVPRLNGLDTYEDLGLAQSADDFNNEKVIDDIDEILLNHKVGVKDKSSINILVLENLDAELPNGASNNPGGISLSDYNKFLRENGKEEFELKKGETIYVHIDNSHDPNALVGDYEPKFIFDYARLALGNTEKKLSLNGEKLNAEINIGRIGFSDVFILDDEDYKELYARSSKNDLVLYNIYKFENPEESLTIKDDIYEKITVKYDENVFLRNNSLKEVKRSFATILFIAFFIAFLFFIASGSVIYFKLFNEIEQDRLEYNILEKIGMQKKDIEKVITRQIGILLFLPFVVGMTHSLFALKSLSNLLHMNLIRNGLIVGLGFFLFQIIYFLIIKNIYMKKLKEF